MRIVQIITGSTSFGGAEAHVRDLAIGLRDRGHQCTVLVGPPEGLLTEQLRAAAVPYVVIPAMKKPIHPYWDLLSLFQLVSTLRKLDPDVVATHTSKAGFVGRIAARLVGVPCFFTPHGVSFINRHTGGIIRFRLALERMASWMGGKLIAVCDFERKLALEFLSSPESEVVTIHNCLPDRSVHETRDSRTPVITMVARFDLQKDHATLFRALSTMLDREWELRLAGSGPLLASAKQMAEEYGLTSRIHFLNQYPDTPGLLAKSDIFALITNWEAFPISILEAMRSGLPVVATDIGGINEAVQEGANGFLIPLRDAHCLANRLTQLLDSAELRQSMGQYSRSLFQQKFEWRSMLDKTEAVYASSLPGLVPSALPSSTLS